MVKENIEITLSKFYKEFKSFKNDMGDFKDEMHEFKQETKADLKEIKGKLLQHTHALLTIENTIQYYGEMYQINKDGIKKLDSRVTILEAR